MSSFSIPSSAPIMDPSFPFEYEPPPYIGRLPPYPPYTGLFPIEEAAHSKNEEMDEKISNKANTTFASSVQSTATPVDPPGFAEFVQKRFRAMYIDNFADIMIVLNQVIKTNQHLLKGKLHLVSANLLPVNNTMDDLDVSLLSENEALQQAVDILEGHRSTASTVTIQGKIYYLNKLGSLLSKYKTDSPCGILDLLNLAMIKIFYINKELYLRVKG